MILLILKVLAYQLPHRHRCLLHLQKRNEVIETTKGKGLILMIKYLIFECTIKKYINVFSVIKKATFHKWLSSCVF